MNHIMMIENTTWLLSIHTLIRFCNGGDLFEHIMDMHEYDEKYSAVIMKNILMPVSYLHELGIVHRDLKPENILLEDNKKNEEISLKLIDFGTAIPLKQGQKLSEKIGTVYSIKIGLLYCTRIIER
jgi:serine/threonine protein kinase